MKTRNIIKALAALILVIPMQSCLKDQEAVFEDSPSARMSKYLSNVQNILVGEETWIMEYYPGAGRMYGGYTYVLKFTDKDVTVWSELDPEMECTSLYRFKADNGPVLSFDTNNDLLHYFATPSSSAYEAMGGDFEFTIVDYRDDQVTLLGKRSQNYYYLRPFTEECTPMEYCQAVVDLTDSFVAATLEGTIGDLHVDGEVDLMGRTLYLYYEGEEDPETGEPVEEVAYEAFSFTPKGLHFYEPLVVNGYTIRDLFYLPTHNYLTNGVITLFGSLPEDYARYEEFAGDYTMYAYEGNIKMNVSLVPTEDKAGYILKGMGGRLSAGHDFDVYLPYDKAKGRLNLNAQVIGNEDGLTIWLAAWSLNDGGSLTWDTAYGMQIHRDLETGNFAFVDNGKTDMEIDSFILWATNAAGKSAGQWTAWGNGQIPYLQYLVRK